MVPIRLLVAANDDYGKVRHFKEQMIRIICGIWAAISLHCVSAQRIVSQWMLEWGKSLSSSSSSGQVWKLALPLSPPLPVDRINRGELKSAKNNGKLSESEEILKSSCFWESYTFVGWLKHHRKQFIGVWLEKFGSSQFYLLFKQPSLLYSCLVFVLLKVIWKFSLVWPTNTNKI